VQASSSLSMIRTLSMATETTNYRNMFSPFSTRVFYISRVFQTRVFIFRIHVYVYTRATHMYVYTEYTVFICIYIPEDCLLYVCINRIHCDSLFVSIQRIHRIYTYICMYTKYTVCSVVDFFSGLVSLVARATRHMRQLQSLVV